MGEEELAQRRSDDVSDLPSTADVVERDIPCVDVTVVDDDGAAVFEDSFIPRPGMVQFQGSLTTLQLLSSGRMPITRLDAAACYGKLECCSFLNSFRKS